MKVFKACFIIIKRRYLSLLMYLGIFIALSVVLSSLLIESYSPGFTETKPNFTVINRDGASPFADGIIAYLSTRGVEVALEDSKETLQDATFYHATDFIIILPEGFSDRFWSGAPSNVEIVMTTDSALGYYADSLVNQYLNLTRVYSAMNPEMNEETLADTVLHDLSARVNVEKKHFGESAPVNENYYTYTRIMPYIISITMVRM